MSIGFDAGQWRNLQELSADNLLNEIKPAADLVMKRALVLFEGEVKRTLTGARSGRAYKVSKTGAMHIASAPGEPPAVLFDNLRLSVGHSGPKWEGATVSGEVGPGLGAPPKGGAPDPGDAYARILELGGVTGAGHNTKILPRPYLAPTEARVEPMIERMFRQAVGSAR